jgi:hypothetical protein
MSDPMSPEEARFKQLADLPKPLKPIPPEIMAELLEGQLPYEDAVREYRELMAQGGRSLEPYLEELKRKYADPT